MNKGIWFVLVPLILMSALGTLRFGMASPYLSEELQPLALVSLTPMLTHKVVGETFSVDVYISNVDNLYGWEFRLFYETHAVDVVDVTEGPFLKSFAEHGSFFGIQQINDAYNSTHGQVWAYCTLLGLLQHTATGNGVLATVTFRCTMSGEAIMTLCYPSRPYPVMLADKNANLIPCEAVGANVFSTGQDTVPLDISIDGGTLYFPGEWAQCYIMTTFRGTSVTPTSIQVWLYDPYGTQVSLGCMNIATGFYRVWHNLPLDAYAGTYAIVVEATYITDSVQAYGTGFKTYQLSSTLNSKLIQLSNTMALIQTDVGMIYTDLATIKLQVTSIDGNVATIQTTLGTLQGTITSVDNNIATITTDIGTIKADISAMSSTLNSKLIQLSNTMALIQTDVGMIYTDLATIKLQVTSIDGNVATIQTTLGTLQGTITSINNNIATITTDIGTIKADISAMKANTTPKALDWNTVGLYVSLALIASIAVVLVVVFIFLRARFRTQATTS